MFSIAISTLARRAAPSLVRSSNALRAGVRFESTQSTANAGIVGGPMTEENPKPKQPSSHVPSSHPASPSSMNSESSSSSADSTTKEILRSEAAAEADASLTRHRAEGDLVAAGVVSGAPAEMARRPVRIYQLSQESTQSAKSTSHHWRIDWDNLPGAGRWENNLMGWASSADYMQGTHVKFNTKDDAIRFAEKQGWSWFLQEPHHVKFVPKSYANNFVYSPKKLRYIRTK